MNNGQTPQPQQQRAFRLGMEPPSMLDPSAEPTYWMGVASIKEGKSPDALLNSARLGDGHALASALWICSSITTAMLFQHINGLQQQIAQLTERITKLETEKACPAPEG